MVRSAGIVIAPLSGEKHPISRTRPYCAVSLTPRQQLILTLVQGCFVPCDQAKADETFGLHLNSMQHAEVFYITEKVRLQYHAIFK